MNPIHAIAQTGRPAIGIYLKSRNELAIETAAAAGLDFVRLDLQHGRIDLGGAKELINRIRDAGLVASARASKNEAVVEEILDAGVEFIVFPCVESGAEAETLASRCASGQREDTVLVSVQIESATGLNDLANIASATGVGMLQCGRSDLARSLGLQEQDREVTLDELEDSIASAARDEGRLTSAHCPPGAASVARAQRWIGLGVSCLTLGSDAQILRWSLDESLRDLATVVSQPISMRSPVGSE